MIGEAAENPVRELGELRALAGIRSGLRDRGIATRGVRAETVPDAVGLSGDGGGKPVRLQVLGGGGVVAVVSVDGEGFQVERDGRARRLGRSADEVVRVVAGLVAGQSWGVVDG
ncbi:hypothetical protein [Acrocarpospora catenulata]|uniref:hypothetical protein n=1 Tax=Acrocarpospora catenulata TaxID=2836182 RepID=UPI001BD9357E|nr:hypothetical protein [Acrocarpospora catenulata]